MPDHGLAVDVGANLGFYSYALQRLGRTVISFEPDRNYQERLARRLGRRARVERVALSDGPGTGVMRVPDLDGEYGGPLGSLSAEAVPDDDVLSSYEVELRTLDSYDLDDVSFIKIDVEGHEEAVLAGATATLRRSTPVLLIEIEERHNAGGLQRIAAALSEFGYTGSYFHDRARHPLTEFDAATLQNTANLVDVHRNRRVIDYVNNFVFTPN